MAVFRRPTGLDPKHAGAARTRKEAGLLDLVTVRD
jgi:hypothetical protein